MSLTARLTFLFAHTSAALLLGVGFLVSNLVDRHFEELDLEALNGKIALVQHALAKVQSRADLEAFPAQVDTALVGHPGLALAIVWPDGSTLFATPGANIPKPQLAQVSDTRPSRPSMWTDRDGMTFRSISALAPLGLPGSPAAIVTVAIDVSHHQHFIASFQRTLWIIVVAAAILSGFVGRIAVRRGLAPLREIKQGASGITASRLDYRLALQSVPPELEELVQALNTMFSRLQESFQRLSDFSSDLAHELRTPVSNMLMQTQVTLSKVRTADEYREILYSNVEEFTRLSRMIGDMLFLAKADHGLVSPFHESVDLVREVQDLFSFFEVVAEAKSVRLALSGNGEVLGDRMLLRRVISNILSNAIRHSTESGEVRFTIEPVAGKDELRLAIDNTGEPIAEEHIPRLFDRFYRVDASRQGSSENVGLGLAIAKSIVVLHGGTIEAKSGNGITRFEIRLPRKTSSLCV
ncbi:heavy metal sensor histidine kinase [Herbaspirillum sp. ST 5-3]|uniref:heavy metal sensor histidine kinase n=1 Tax=Oxalobacteraceae TaxID=75682 RepID=UPI001FFF6078|nr:heavy metal sensor histidine kinase [Herbaspirillum sp. ST 5-3]